MTKNLNYSEVMAESHIVLHISMNKAVIT